MTDPQTKKKIIRINPDLTEELLQEVIVETRASIINLYLTCETDFANGIKIYEAIVDKKIIETASSQIQTMEKNRERLVTDEEIPKPAELKELKEIADRKIQKQKEKVANEQAVIQKEQEKVEIVKPVIREIEEAPKVEVEQQHPQVKVQINVQWQGQGQEEGQNEVEVDSRNDVKEEIVVEENVNTGGKSKRRMKKIKNRTRKSKK